MVIKLILVAFCVLFFLTLFIFAITHCKYIVRNTTTIEEMVIDRKKKKAAEENSSSFQPDLEDN